MKGLLIKDFLNLKQQLKTLSVILIFFAFVSIQSNNPIYLVTMASILISMMSLTSMAYDDLAKWDVYVQTMPIKKEDIVKSKFILLLILTTIPLLLSGSISYFLILPKTDMQAKEFLIASFTIYLLINIFSAILITFVYRYGIEKSRVISILLFAIPAGIIFLLNKMGLPLPTEDQVMLILKVLPVIGILIFTLCMKLSIKIYKSKDF